MPDYKKMYLKMFSAAEDAINAVEQASAGLEGAVKVLVAAQRECEEMYISEPENAPELKVLTFQGTETPEGE